MNTLWRFGALMVLLYVVVMPLAVLNKKRRIGALTVAILFAVLFAVGTIILWAGREPFEQTAAVAVIAGMTAFATAIGLYQLSEHGGRPSS